MCHPVPYVYLLPTQRDLHALQECMACEPATAMFFSIIPAKFLTQVIN